MPNKSNHPAPVQCGGCRGSGECSACYGDGRIGIAPDPDAIVIGRDGRPLPKEGIKCHRCGGNGVCPGCKGSGWLVVPGG